MFRLARIRATSVGPDGARFDRPNPGAPPFELDLTANGRPSDTVIWLENGGGKTVFLTLLFHVLRPDHAARIGDEGGKKGSISDFLRTDDVAHFQLEWLACDADGNPTGPRLVTGLVVEQHAGAKGPDRTWYALRVQDGSFTLADIPTERDGRRIPKRVFLELLRDLVQDPARRRKLGLRVTSNNVTKWLSALAEEDLDPALLDYQVGMNRIEGGAAQLFRFRTDEKFLEFLLELVTAPEALESTTETLGRIAEKVASLPTKEREVAFAAGALGHIEPLAREHERAEQAAARLRDRQASARVLLKALVVASDDAGRTYAAETQNLEDAQRVAGDADRTRRMLDDDRRQLALDLAGFTLAAAKEALDTAKSDEALAVLEKDSWDAVPARLELLRHQGRVDTLADDFDAAELQARPLREKRDAAGGNLRLRLLADSLILSTEATQHKEFARSTLEGVRGTRAMAGSLRQRSGERGASAKELRRRLDAHAERVGELAGSSLLHPGETPGGALERLRSAVGQVKSRIEEIDRRRDELARQLEQLTSDDRKLTDEAADKARKAQQLRDRAEEGERERNELLRGNRLAEAAEVPIGELDLEAVGSALIDRLESAARSSDSRRVDAEVRAADDVRAVASLDGGVGLLPARPEVVEIVDYLRGAGITGVTSGWRHLADAITPARREAVLQACPALADGVIVSTSQLPRAVSALRSTAMLPAAAIVIGTTEALAAAEAMDSEIADDAFVIPPAPALFDRQAAVDELARRQTRLTEVEELRPRLEAAARDDRALAAELGRHLQRWPPGTLHAALTAATTAADNAIMSREARDKNRLSITEHRLADGELVRRRALLDREKTDSESARDAVAPVAHEAAALTDAPKEAAEAAQTAEDLECQAAELEASAEKATADAIQLSERSAELTMNAEIARTEATSVPAKPHPREGRLTVVEDLDASAVTVAREVAAGATLPALRDRFTLLDRELAAATTDSQLARELTEARRALADASSVWTARRPALRNLAESLAQTPKAQDPAARSAASRAAEVAFDCARERTNSATSTRDAAKREYDTLQRPERSGPRPDTPPASADEAYARTREVDEKYNAAAVRRSIAETEIERAEQAAEEARLRAEGIRQQAKTLANALREPVTAALDAMAFAGTVDDAIAAVGAATDGLVSAYDDQNSATDARRGHADALTTFAREERWHDLAGYVYRRLAQDAPARLAADATDLASQLRILKERLDSEIASMSEHRALLVASLGELVSGGVSSLRQATNRSRLPADLGDWSHRPFLKIDFTAPTEPEIEHRLSAFVTDLIGRPPDRRPVGTALLTQAILACIAGGVRVSILKPNRAMALTYVSIQDMAVLSGGMRATAAIAMFCTLARLRAANRTRNTDGGVATLILDNPFGDANAVYLVSLQRLVAEGARIQLVYTTGINDFDALRLFPNPIRLANMTSRRAGLNYVVGDPDFLKLLWPNGDEARIAATRLTREHAPRLVP